MSWELLHLADGKVSVRRDGRELGIMPSPRQIRAQEPRQDLQADYAVRMWATEMERLLNQAEENVKTGHRIPPQRKIDALLGEVEANRGGGYVGRLKTRIVQAQIERLEKNDV